MMQMKNTDQMIVDAGRGVDGYRKSNSTLLYCRKKEMGTVFWSDNKITYIRVYVVVFSLSLIPIRWPLFGPAKRES